MLGWVPSVLSTSVETSACRHITSMVRDGLEGQHNSGLPSFIREPGVVNILFHILLLPICLLVDVIQLCIALTSPFTDFTRKTYFRLWKGSEQQGAVLDLHCISRTLQMPLDVPARLSALNFLATMTQTPVDTTLVIDCFDTLIGCIKVTNGKVTVIQGLEQLATVSALCCLHTLSHIVATDTIVNIEGVRHRYTRVFPPETNFDGLPFSHTLGAIHTVFYQTRKFRVGLPTSMDQITLITWRSKLAGQDRWWEDGKPSDDERALAAEVLGGLPRKAWRVQWKDYGPSGAEHGIVAIALTRLALFEYRRRGHRKVPRWLLRFAFHSLSQYPLPPTSVIVNCLSIIAIDMGCSLGNTVTPYERCVYTY